MHPNFSLDRIMGEFNTPKILDWSLELRVGRPAFDALVSAFGKKIGNLFQRRNVLHAIYRIRHWDLQVAIRTFCLGMADEDRSLRSAAVRYAVGTLITSDLTPNRVFLAGPEQLDVVAHAEKLGLNKGTQRMLEKYRVRINELAK